MMSLGRKILLPALAILLACLIAGCGTGKATVPSNPEVRGTITSVSGSATAGSIFIDGTTLETTGIDKASVTIDSKTEILRRQGGKFQKARFSDLRVGQTAQATFTGPVLQSYPVQGTARQVVILSAASGQ
jgi:hypothetical protein